MHLGLRDEEGQVQAAALLELILQLFINLPLLSGKMKAHLAPPANVAVAKHLVRE
jgi:hypothetical protein